MIASFQIQERRSVGIQATSTDLTESYVQQVAGSTCSGFTRHASAKTSRWSSAYQMKFPTIHLSQHCFAPALRRHYHVAFFGSDDVSLATLRALHDSQLGIGERAGIVSSLHIICPSDRPIGRGKRTQSLPVKAYAEAHSLPYEEVPYGM
jgi:hypothetical protein